MKTWPLTVLLTLQIALLGGVIVRLNALAREVRRAGAATGPRPAADVVDVEPGNGPAKGSTDALVTIVEFADFTCSACAAMQPVVRRAVERPDGRIRWVFRHFPLAEGRPFDLALAAECARRQDAFWPMHDALFAAAARGDASLDLGEQAAALGLDLARFASCRDSPEAAAAVREDAAAGHRYGVQGTPTLFVNGRRVEGSLSADRLALEIEHALAYSLSPQPSL